MENIKIQDWTGKVLFEGPYNSPRVLEIMQLNNAPNDDVFVYWSDENIEKNVYEYIDF
jgi:hypothetical protein